MALDQALEYAKNYKTVSSGKTWADCICTKDGTQMCGFHRRQAQAQLAPQTTQIGDPIYGLNQDLGDKSALYSAPSGATSRSKAPDYTLCPLEAIDDIVERGEYGIKAGHDRDNWKSGKNDEVFVKERANHAIRHLLSAVQGNGDWTDIQAALFNLSMLSWWRKNGTGLAKAFPNLAPPAPAGPLVGAVGGCLPSQSCQDEGPAAQYFWPGWGERREWVGGD